MYVFCDNELSPLRRQFAGRFLCHQMASNRLQAQYLHHYHCVDHI